MNHYQLLSVIVHLSLYEAVKNDAAELAGHGDLVRDIFRSVPLNDASEHEWSEWSRWGACSQTDGKEGKRGRSRSCSYVNRCIGSSREEENCQLFVSASADMMWQRPDGHKVLQKEGVKGIRFQNGDFVFLLRIENPGDLPVPTRKNHYHWHRDYGMVYEYVHTKNDGTVNRMGLFPIATKVPKFQYTPAQIITFRYCTGLYVQGFG